MAESSIKLGRVSLSPRGTYDAAAVYNRLDVVEYEGSSYLVLEDSTTGAIPAEGQAYMLLAEKGDKGEPGGMQKSIYDPQDHNTDIFAYVDNAITGAMEASY